MAKRRWSHHFTTADGEPTCVICGAREADAFQDHIGCEAGPEGNPPSYLGFAMTPYEYGLGYTGVQKMLYLTGGSTEPVSVEELRQRSDRWREKILRELAERGIE